MPRLEDWRYFKFTVDGKDFVLKTGPRYEGLATAFSMTPISPVNGVVPIATGEVVTSETAIKRGVMVPMVVNFRESANAKKRGRGVVGVPIDKISQIDTVSSQTYGEGRVITSLKFSTRRDFR